MVIFLFVTIDLTIDLVNLFVNIEKTFQKKITAFKKYKHEIHPFPHPRSIDAIKSKSQNIGSSVGIKFAEAFFIVFDIK